MKGIELFLVILLLTPFQLEINAQTKDSFPNIIVNIDSVNKIQESVSDSFKVVELEKTLTEARLNEMNLRMEMEALRMAATIEDSLKRAQQKLRIDSLRSITKGIPVVIEEDTLYYLYSKRGGVSPQLRAQQVEEAMLLLGKQLVLQPDSLYLDSTDISTDVMYGSKVIASFTDFDALWENTTRGELAESRKVVIANKLRELQEEYGLSRLLKRVLYSFLVIMVQFLLILGTLRLYRWIKVKIDKLSNSKMKPLSFHDYEILDKRKQVRILFILIKLFCSILVIMQLVISVPILFSIFPQTEALAYEIFSYIWNPVKSIFVNIVGYMPKLFTIIVIWLVIRYLVKAISYFAKEIESEKLKIRGFYPDWAQPSYQIIRFLLYAFMIAMIYPYLPGADGTVFQGVSVFVGLIISLGSTSVIGNIMAGLVITYMRPFKIGDRIKLNDTIGNVMEKTPFVTRIKTPKNEIITIPNSFILSSHTVNYSASARDYGLVIHSEISFGFEERWDKIHALLIEAAQMTPGVLPDPKPFVHDISINDFYPIYQINAYIKDADKQPQIYSDLHKNIRDLADKEGVELLSPHYYAYRDGNKSTIPEGYKQK